jgi:hypothetical protein
MNTEGFELKFTKLDKRHRGYEQFSHYVTVVENSIDRYRLGKPSYTGFFGLRGLCSGIWGMSCERDLWLKLRPGVINGLTDVTLNNHWVWHTDLNNSQYRIYLRGDEEKSWLLLKW